MRLTPLSRAAGEPRRGPSSDRPQHLGSFALTQVHYQMPSLHLSRAPSRARRQAFVCVAPLLVHVSVRCVACESSGSWAWEAPPPLPRCRGIPWYAVALATRQREEPQTYAWIIHTACMRGLRRVLCGQVGRPEGTAAVGAGAGGGGPGGAGERHLPARLEPVRPQQAEVRRAVHLG